MGEAEIAEPIKLGRCRIPGCTEIVYGKSSLCHPHILSGRAAIDRQYRNGTAVFGRRATRWTKLYAIKAGDFVKIGVTDHPSARFQAIQTSCPLEAEVLGCIPAMQCVEGAIHEVIRHEWVHGEWFHLRGLAADVAEAIAARRFEDISEIARVPPEWVGVEQPTKKIQHPIEKVEKFWLWAYGVKPSGDAK